MAIARLRNELCLSESTAVGLKGSSHANMLSGSVHIVGAAVTRAGDVWPKSNLNFLEDETADKALCHHHRYQVRVLQTLQDAWFQHAFAQVEFSMLCVLAS